jgi:hypothetical protein
VKSNALAATVAAILPLFAHADAPSEQAVQAVQAVQTPAVPYRSAFGGLTRGVEEGTVDWKAANAEVGRFPRGHVDLLKWEQAQGANGVTAPSATPQAEPPAPRTSAPAAPAAAGHRH